MRILVCVLLVLSAPAALSAQLVVGSGCGGSGWEGTLSEAGDSIEFETCPTAEGWVSTIRDSYDQMLSQIEYANDSIVTIQVGGIDISTTLSQEEEDLISSILDGPLAPLAAIAGTELEAFGFGSTSLVVRSVHAHSQLYELPGSTTTTQGCRDSSTDCYGCCGKGCSGCKGICTRACHEHDACVRQHGSGQIQCLHLATAAAMSYLACSMTCHAPGCDDGPLACCDNRGEACW